MVIFPKLVGRLFAVGLTSLIALCAVRADEPTKAVPRPLAGWVKKSNQHAKLMIELMAKLAPEQAAQLGVEGYDDQITDFSPGFVERQLKATRAVHAELVRRLAEESDPLVKQDLEILVKAASDMIKGTELSERLEVPSFSLDQLMFQSFRGLLDDQVSASRCPAAWFACASTRGSSRAPSRSPSSPLPISARSWHSATSLPPVKSKLPEGHGSGHVLCGGCGKAVRAVQASWLRAGV